MDMFTTVFAAAAVIVLLRLLRSVRRSRHAHDREHAERAPPTSKGRDIVRRELVARAVRLCEMEEEVARFAEGSRPGMPMDEAQDRAERLREEAVRLRACLEAECRRLRLPIGLVRHQRRPLGTPRRP